MTRPADVQRELRKQLKGLAEEEVRNTINDSKHPIACKLRLLQPAVRMWAAGEGHMFYTIVYLGNRILLLVPGNVLEKNQDYEGLQKALKQLLQAAEEEFKAYEDGEREQELANPRAARAEFDNMLGLIRSGSAIAPQNLIQAGLAHRSTRHIPTGVLRILKEGLLGKMGEAGGPLVQAARKLLDERTPGTLGNGAFPPMLKQTFATTSRHLLAIREAAHGAAAAAKAKNMERCTAHAADLVYYTSNLITELFEAVPDTTKMVKLGQGYALSTVQEEEAEWEEGEGEDNEEEDGDSEATEADEPPHWAALGGKWVPDAVAAGTAAAAAEEAADPSLADAGRLLETFSLPEMDEEALTFLAEVQQYIYCAEVLEKGAALSERLDLMSKAAEVIDGAAFWCQGGAVTVAERDP